MYDLHPIGHSQTNHALFGDRGMQVASLYHLQHHNEPSAHHQKKRAVENPQAVDMT